MVPVLLFLSNNNVVLGSGKRPPTETCRRGGETAGTITAIYMTHLSKFPCHWGPHQGAPRPFDGASSVINCSRSTSLIFIIFPPLGNTSNSELFIARRSAAVPRTRGSSFPRLSNSRVWFSVTKNYRRGPLRNPGERTWSGWPRLSDSRWETNTCWEYTFGFHNSRPQGIHPPFT